MRFGLPVRAHLLMPSPIPVHKKNLSILLSWDCIWFILEDMTAKSFAYAAELMVVFEVLNV